MKLYISDLHFFEDIKMDNRGFEDIQTMNQYMISQWNKKIKGGDQIYVLGDMFGTKNPDEVNSVLNRLNGKIFLIEGNHDYRWIKKEGININRFEWIKSYAELSDTNRTVICSHYPVFCYNHQYLTFENGEARTYMLYGHVHNSHDEVLINQFQQLTQQTVLKSASETRKIPCNMINCFCKFSDYIPLSLDEWINLDKNRRKQIIIPENQIIDDEIDLWQK